MNRFSMRTKSLFLTIAPILVMSALTIVSCSDVSSMPPAIMTQVPTQEPPRPTITPLPYSLCLFVTGKYVELSAVGEANGLPVAGAIVELSVVDGTFYKQTSSEIGEVCWSNLPGATINLVISKPGYSTKEETLTLDRGRNGVVMRIERDRLEPTPNLMLTSEPVAIAETQASSIPLVRAHAHNDYEHPRPLFDALEHGFTSIEVDIHLVEGELYVAHGISEIQPGRTLISLYLDPLRERITYYGGWVYLQGPQITLLIDIKTEAESTYLALRSILEEYQDIFTVFRPSGVNEGPILAIISGNRPRELMQSESVRYAAYDGRIEDLESADLASFIPLISGNWTNFFTWRGIGPMPEQERKTLRDMVERAHLEGRRIRFWATPDYPSTARDAVWLELLEAGVDLINTDDLQGLQQFLIANPQGT